MKGMEGYTLDADEGQNERDINLEELSERPIVSVSGPLSEHLGLHFTTAQLEEFQDKVMKAHGVDFDMIGGIDENEAREIATLASPYFDSALSEEERVELSKRIAEKIKKRSE